MNSLVALSIWICLVVAVDGVCFIKGVPEQHKERDMKKISAPALKKCQEKIPPLSGQDLEKCINETLDHAVKDCSKKSIATDLKAWYTCFVNKLGSEKPTEEEMSFDYYKKEVLSLTQEESKKAVGEALDKCKADPNFWECGYVKMSEGPCPEVKEFSEKLKEWKKAME